MYGILPLGALTKWFPYIVTTIHRYMCTTAYTSMQAQLGMSTLVYNDIIKTVYYGMRNHRCTRKIPITIILPYIFHNVLPLLLLHHHASKWWWITPSSWGETTWPHPATCGIPGSHTQHHTAPTTCTESELESLGPMGILLTSFIADLCTGEG